MSKSQLSFFIVGFVLIFLQSSCAKKLSPVSGSAGLNDEQVSETDTLPNGFNGDPSSPGREETLLGEGSNHDAGTDDNGAPLLNRKTEREMADEEARNSRSEQAVIKELSDVFFEYNKAVLHKDSKRVLQENARRLSLNPKAKVRIEGHTDERGSNEYNLTLGARRARTVKRFLEALGVETHRINIISFGEEKPFCERSRESCWRLNRRVHFRSQG